MRDVFCFVMYARTYVVVTQIFGADFSRRINYEIYTYDQPIKVNKSYSSQMSANNTAMPLTFIENRRMFEVERL